MYKAAKVNFKSIILKIKLFGLTKFSSGKRRKSDMELDVLVFGSANIDYITYVNELPRPGETLFGMYREQCYGGKGASQCVAAAKLGGRCALVSKLGNDKLGDDYFEYLRELGINVDFVERAEGQQTGLSEIIVADNTENAIIVMAGANQCLKSTDVSRARRVFKRAKVLICQLETNEKAALCALQQFKGETILNVSPVPKNMNEALIKVPTILCVNRLEAAQLTGREEIKTLQDAKAAANDLIDKGAKSVIITMGPLGAVHLSSKDRDVCTQCPAAPVRFLADTSGAGEAFLGSLAYHMSMFPNLCRESHISAANICAAYAVGHRGTQPSFPGPDLFQEDLCQMTPEFNVIPDKAPTPEPAVSESPSGTAGPHVPEADPKPEPPADQDESKESNEPNKIEEQKKDERVTIPA
ncbi:ribokinase [Drosophila montana]|uniref:ribokinase n=1 Tax=Drosophila montana TaxID=40370 RepID=UPI00313E6667